MIDNEIPAVNDLLRPIHQALTDSNITPERLAQKLDEELEANTTKTQKINGIVYKSNLEKGVKILADASETHVSQQGNEYETGQTLIAWDEIDWNTRQKARMDGHKLLGHYPKQEIDLTVAGVIGLKEALDSAETQEPFKPGNDG